MCYNNIAKVETFPLNCKNIYVKVCVMKKLLSCLIAFLLTFTMASCTVVSNSASGSGNSGSSSGTEDVTPEPVTLAGKQFIFLGSSLTDPIKALLTAPYTIS